MSAVIRIAETDEKKVTEETDQVSVVKPNSKLEEDEEGEPLCTIKVTGFSKLTSPDTMLHYFENAKQSGGGYLKDFVGHDEEDYAYVTFEQEDGLNPFYYFCSIGTRGRNIPSQKVSI